MGNACYAEFCACKARVLTAHSLRVKSATKGRAQTYISYTIRSILQVLD